MMLLLPNYCSNTDNTNIPKEESRPKKAYTNSSPNQFCQRIFVFRDRRKDYKYHPPSYIRLAWLVILYNGVEWRQYKR